MMPVFYSLVCDPGGAHERQWALSVASLRQHNPTVPVSLCLWGPARQETLDTAARCNVRVRNLGAYQQVFAELPRPWREVFLHFPTLHKLPALRSLRADTPAERYLYLDCDTYFYDDVVSLGESACDTDWTAREEPCTRRSPFGYDPMYLDEDALSAMTSAVGVVGVPPYNTGVFVLSDRAAGTLVDLLDDFLWYAWRLLLGAALWRPQLFGPGLAASSVTAAASPAQRLQALPYPSTNLWIFEQVATWLVLGRVPDLRHAAFSPRLLAQSNEFLAQHSGVVAVHYFSTLHDQFVAHLGRS